MLDSNKAQILTKKKNHLKAYVYVSYNLIIRYDLYDTYHYIVQLKNIYNMKLFCTQYDMHHVLYDIDNYYDLSPNQ